MTLAIALALAFAHACTCAFALTAASGLQRLQSQRLRWEADAYEYEYEDMYSSAPDMYTSTAADRSHMRMHEAEPARNEERNRLTCDQAGTYEPPLPPSSPPSSRSPLQASSYVLRIPVALRFCPSCSFPCSA